MKPGIEMNCVSKLNCFEAEFLMSRKRMKNKLQETQKLVRPDTFSNAAGQSQ